MIWEVGGEIRRLLASIETPVQFFMFLKKASPVLSVIIICRFQPFPCLTKTVY